MRTGLTPKAIANGNPRCWHCLKRFVYRRGGGFIFDLVVARDGGEHRVHKDCVTAVCEDGHAKPVPRG